MDRKFCLDNGIVREIDSRGGGLIVYVVCCMLYVVGCSLFRIMVSLSQTYFTVRSLSDLKVIILVDLLSNA